MKTFKQALIGLSFGLALSAAASAQSPRIYAADGTYLGDLNSNRFAQNSVSNPYGPYGSPYSSTSINNPYSQYGSPYSPLSPNNPYASGTTILTPVPTLPTLPSLPSLPTIGGWR